MLMLTVYIQMCVCVNEEGGGINEAIAHLKPEKQKTDFYKTSQEYVKKSHFEIKIVYNKHIC